MTIRLIVSEIYGETCKSPEKSQISAVAMATAYAKIPKLCILVELKVLYIYLLTP